jgi:serine/threonine-protein kinase
LSSTSQDDAFLNLAQKRGLLSAEQSQELRDQQRAEAERGAARPLAQIALEKQVISAEDAAKTQEDAWIQGLPRRLGDYDLVRLLGRGGMSAVFQAQGVSLGKTVAVKVLLPHFAQSTSYLARFRREAALAAKPSHPNTVQVFHYGEQDGIHYLVMEYVEGPSVASLVQAQGPLAEQEALDVAIRVARSLAEAHEYGIIHRDVKPANIKVSKFGGVKLMDFGIAKLKGDLGDEQMKQTVTVGVVGTPHYMSPEQARGAKTLDYRTDMYSLGATLFYMLAGQTPYPSAAPQEVLHRIASGPPRSLRDLRAGLNGLTYQIVERMMARSADDRFRSFAELIGALEAARDLVATAARKTLTPEESQELAKLLRSLDRRASWTRTLLTAGIVAVAGLLVLLLLSAKGCV